MAEIPTITRSAWILAVSLALLSAGCSTGSGASGPTRTTTVILSESSPVSLPSATMPTGVNPSPSSSVPIPNLPSTDQSPATALSAWPPDFTSEQVADAQAAIDAYTGFWSMIDSAIARPEQDWAEQIAYYSTGPAKASVEDTLTHLTDTGRIAVGTTAISPLVTEVQEGMVVISDCVDKTNTDILDSAGRSVKAPDVQGTYFRHPSTVQMVRTGSGRWVVTFTAGDWSLTC